MKYDKPLTGLAALLAMGGFVLSAYLALLTLSDGSAAGCGGGSSCAEVLGSRWANIGPVPVALLGTLTYLGVLLGLGARLGSKATSALSDRLLWLAAPLLLVAALWFSAVQLIDLGAVCPYCMASHGVGLALFAVLSFGLLRYTVINPKPLVLLGFLAGGTMIAVQLGFPPKPGPPQAAANPFPGRDGDAVIGDKRYVSAFGGELQFVLEEAGYIGDPRAEQVVVVLFDYACPHCKTLHKLLGDAIAQDPGRFVLVPLPMSAYADVNPYIASDNLRFEHSQEIAALSLAVAAADREAWVAFDRWLFAQPQPIDRSAARIEAERLVGLTALAEQLDGENAGRITAQIVRNIGLLSLIPDNKRFIPVTTTPGAPEHLTTRFDDISVLYELLDAASRTDR